MTIECGNPICYADRMIVSPYLPLDHCSSFRIISCWDHYVTMKLASFLVNRILYKSGNANLVIIKRCLNKSWEISLFWKAGKLFSAKGFGGFF